MRPLDRYNTPNGQLRFLSDVIVAALDALEDSNITTAMQLDLLSSVDRMSARLQRLAEARGQLIADQLEHLEQATA